MTTKATGESAEPGKGTPVETAAVYDLFDASVAMDRLSLAERLRVGSERSRALTSKGQGLMRRQLDGADGRSGQVLGPDGSSQSVLNFGSNDYLGLSHHPQVVEAAREAVRLHGAGTPGSPLFNGFTAMHGELEERLSALKGAEASIIFSSGYAANVGLMSALPSRHDVAFLDRGAHGSLWDGFRLSGARSRLFRHNDAEDLATVIEEEDNARDKFIIVDGIYSMDGDSAPLDELLAVSRKTGAFLIVDDAHGTGVVGETGRGTLEAFGIEGQVDATVGTLGKSLGAIGGWVSGSTDLIDYLRVFGRSYLFSTSLPPAVVGAALASLDVMDAEPERRHHLLAMVARAADGLRPLGLSCEPAAAIISVPLPSDIDIKAAVTMMESAGIFVNYAVFPAVPRHQQRFRVSLTAEHQPEDVDRLIEVFHAVFAAHAHREPT